MVDSSRGMWLTPMYASKRSRGSGRRGRVVRRATCSTADEDKREMGRKECGEGLMKWTGGVDVTRLRRHLRCCCDGGCSGTTIG